MATCSVARARRRRREILLPIPVSADELREIALRGYEGAVSTDPKAQVAAVVMFLSDQLLPT